MITNNLLIKLKTRNWDNVARAKEVLLSMKGKIEVLKDIQVETDIRNSESSYDLLLVTHFTSMADMETYLIDPVHVEVSKYIGGIIEAGASVCYESE